MSISCVLLYESGPLCQLFTLAAGSSRNDRSRARELCFLPPFPPNVRVEAPRAKAHNWRVAGAGGPDVLSVAVGLHTTGDRGLVWVWALKIFRCFLDVSTSKPTALLLIVLLHAVLASSSVGTGLIPTTRCFESLTSSHIHLTFPDSHGWLGCFPALISLDDSVFNFTYQLVYQLLKTTAQCNTGRR